MTTKTPQEIARELLELAAKAAGMTHMVFNQGKTSAYYAGGLEYMTSPGSHTPWNPLTDDGDALRLAVKLKMHLDCELRCASTDERTWEDGDRVIDDYAATRRAIVRAAAEIGKAMP